MDWTMSLEPLLHSRAIAGPYSLPKSAEGLRAKPELPPSTLGFARIYVSFRALWQRDSVLKAENVVVTRPALTRPEPRRPSIRLPSSAAPRRSAKKLT